MASPEDARAALAGSCSKSHQSLLVLPPWTWWAEVALPQRKSSGKSVTGVLSTRPGGLRAWGLCAEAARWLFALLVFGVRVLEDLIPGRLVAEDLLQAAEHGLLDLGVGPELVHERDGLVPLDERGQLLEARVHRGAGAGQGRQAALLFVERLHALGRH